MSTHAQTITIQAFASAADAIGARERTMDIPQSCSIAQVWARLMESHPDLRTLETTMAFAINDQLVASSAILEDGDILALLPPVSGG